MRRFIPQEIKEKARKLIMGGTTRKDAAFILNQNISDVYKWTSDLLFWVGFIS